MNMDLWVREQIATQDKKAMPLLSYPAVQQQFITVDQLIHSSSEMALGVRLMADRYNMPFASTYMDLSIEAEAFGAKCTYHENDIPTITGQLISTQEQADALVVPGGQQKGMWRAARPLVEKFAADGHRVVHAAAEL